MEKVIDDTLLFKAWKDIARRQGEPWNDGRINDTGKYPYLTELYRVVNKNKIHFPWTYKGIIYRVHSAQDENIKEGPVNGDIIDFDDDGYGLVLPHTDYSSKELVAFTKNGDFTHQKEDGIGNVFYKLSPDEICRFIVLDTGDLLGIDVVALKKKLGISSEIYDEEQEVLFPLLKECVVAEYTCTPNQFKQKVIKGEA